MPGAPLTPETHDTCCPCPWESDRCHGGTSYIFMFLPGLFILEGMAGVIPSPTPFLFWLSVSGLSPLASSESGTAFLVYMITWKASWKSALHSSEASCQILLIMCVATLSGPSTSLSLCPCWRPVSSLHYRKALRCPSPPVWSPPHLSSSAPWEA